MEAELLLSRRSLADWTLEKCCSDVQIIFLSLLCVYSVVIFVFWRWQFLLPFKLITVFLHEFSHATATWLSGGSVVSIEVHGNEGGVTKTAGGTWWVILPAGYLGSSFWGAYFIVSSVDAVAVQVSSAILVIALLVVLYLADNNSLRGLCLLFLLLLAGMWACQLLTEFPGLQVFVLFIGTMNGWFSIYDCYDDLIRRRENSSDAAKFAEKTHTSARCWGILWALISMFFMGIGIYIALVAGSS